MWGLAYPARPHDPKPFHENNTFANYAKLKEG